jgi:hypothetical protein
MGNNAVSTNQSILTKSVTSNDDGRLIPNEGVHGVGHITNVVQILDMVTSPQPNLQSYANGSEWFVSFNCFI